MGLECETPQARDEFQFVFNTGCYLLSSPSTEAAAMAIPALHVCAINSVLNRHCNELRKRLHILPFVFKTSGVSTRASRSTAVRTGCFCLKQFAAPNLRRKKS